MRLKKSEAAKFKGVSPAAITKATKNGRLKIGKDGLIDTEDPHNRSYFVKDEAESAKHHAEISEREHRRNKNTKVDKNEDEEDDSIYLRKDKAAIAFREIQTKLKTFDYAKKLETVIDRETIATLFGQFSTILQNSLISLPKNASYLLWAVASTADDPELAIEKELENYISNMINQIKEMTNNITPPRHGARYVFIDDEDLLDGEEDVN